MIIDLVPLRPGVTNSVQVTMGVAEGERLLRELPTNPIPGSALHNLVSGVKRSLALDALGTAAGIFKRTP